MTVTIHIEAHPDRGDLKTQIDRSMSALGFLRQSVSAEALHAAEAAADRFDGLGVAADEAANQETTAAEAPTPTRQRGQPSPGKTRRTKAEIAEDEAADAAEAAAQKAAADADIQAETADDVKPSISTGESRVGPEDPQDEADEAAETAANGGLAPIDELRRVVGDYQKKFGMPAAVALCQEGGLIGCGIVDLPEDDIPAAIANVRKALDGKAPETTGGSAEAKDKPEEAEKPATKEDLQRAMLRYAKRFDGQAEDMTKMPATMEDCPKIFALLFGEGVTKLSQVPADGYAKAIAGIDEAIQKNPFKRGV